MTTWVASQKFVSSTATSIVSVSPPSARLCATISVTKPSALPQTRPMAFFQNRSSNSPRPTLPQPMKMADEYRLVTGGRPSSHIRKISPTVCSTKATAISQNDALRAHSAKLNQKKQPRRNAMR